MRRPVPLLAAHHVEAFDSGEPAIDVWLRTSAYAAQQRGTARTFVVIDQDWVVGYYSLCAHTLRRDDLPNRLGRGSPAEIPAVLLARLGVDHHYQGGGLGAALLSDALRRVVDATRTVGARFVVVDALHEKAADFYAHHGFGRVPGSLRLARKLSEVAGDLARDDKMPG